MPELPEVETVRKYLEKNTIGLIIEKIDLYSQKSLRNDDITILNKLIKQKIEKVDRIAKNLIIKLEKHYLILHLRMEGKLVFYDSIEELEKQNKNHFIIVFKTNKGYILFKDFRKFATIDVFENETNYKDNPILSRIAEEATDIKPQILYERLKNKRIKIKTALLDQSIISGLGNIYVNEILFFSKINPNRSSNKVSLEDCESLVLNSIKIINRSIELGGTSIHSFTSGNDVKGGYYKELRVHSLKKCLTCGSDISKEKINGRGTYYCPICQNN